MDYVKLLEETKEFRAKLVEFRGALDVNDHEKIGTLTSNLTVLWGSIGDDLISLGMPHEFEAGGRMLPIIESAINPSFHEYEPDHETLDIAQQAIDIAIGKINRRIRNTPASPSVVAAPEPAPPVPELVPVARERRRFLAFAWGLTVLVIAAISWIGGRNQDGIWNALARCVIWLKDLFFTGDRPLVILSTLVGVFASGMLVNRIHQDGWVEAFRRHQVSTLVYIVLAIACTAAVVALAN